MRLKYSSVDTREWSSSGWHPTDAIGKHCLELGQTHRHKKYMFVLDRGMGQAGVLTGRVLKIRKSIAFGPEQIKAMVGCIMEETQQLLEESNEEVEKSKKTLEQLDTKVKALAEVVLPELLRQTKKIRDARMTVTQEVATSMSALKDIRKFFLEKDYDVEMERLERFVAVCKELDDLKKSGVLDAVADVAIRLGLEERGE